MSGTANEFEEPGGNYPDSQKQQAPVEDRGGSAPDDTPSGTGTQDGPVLAQNEATDLDRLSGIVVQTRADLAGEDVATIEQALRHRLTDAGIALDEAEVAALARDLAKG